MSDPVVCPSRWDDPAAPDRRTTSVYGCAAPDLLASDGSQPRRYDHAVQHLRKRMCYELNFATSSLYRTARYLAYARLVHQHLSGGGSSLAPDRESLERLIADAGAGLQGETGAGIFSEQQESIAEMMVDFAGRVLSHYDFRRRLLELPGWEQFTALFLFFISEDDRLDGQDARARFVAKVPHEVQATTGALARLETRLVRDLRQELGRPVVRPGVAGRRGQFLNTSGE